MSRSTSKTPEEGAPTWGGRAASAGDSARFRADLAALEISFERALGTMALGFQPIVWAADHRLFAYEALLRPNHPELPHPGAMLDAAERLNRLPRLGRAIRARAARDFAAAGDERGLLFINLHALDLLDRSLSSAYSPLSKLRHRVVLEITERASLEGLDDIGFRVAALREMGFRIAIDDFGAGHSRTQQITPLETDFVKLDMSLVRGIDQHPIKQRLVSSIIRLCRDQGIRIVAEGVETGEERATLVELGCELLQGYYIARPGPPFVEVSTPPA